MSLTPAQMGDAIVRNLEAKTGYGLAHWLDVLHEGGASGKKSALAYLKSAGLGHFQAQKVWEAAQGEDPYADPEALVREQFSAGQRDAYAAFAKTCYALGDDVEVHPCRTYVPFYAARQFAMLTARPDGSLAVGLALPDDVVAGAGDDGEGGVLTSAKGLGGSARVNAAFALAPSGVPTAAQARVLAQAYRYNTAEAPR